MTAADVEHDGCFWLIAGLFLFWVGIALVAASSCGCSRAPVLTPQDQADIADHAVTLERCIQVGKGVGPDGGYEAYLVCLEDAGVKQP
jgi:hypothetical protein